MRQVFIVLLGILMVPTVCFGGDIQTDGQLKSTVERGTPPIEVASQDMVVNLNADMVDGVHATEIYTKAEVDALVTAAVESAESKKYYLSVAFSDGIDSLTVCATGFHMASIWEIYDHSTLQYAWDLADAIVAGDNGAGPPGTTWGWVRTGSPTYQLNEPGRANCGAHTSDSGDHFGTLIFLTNRWSDPTVGGVFTAVPGSTWYSLTGTCDTLRRTWCIED